MKKAILIFSTILGSMSINAQSITGSTSLCQSSSGSLISDSTGGAWVSGNPSIATIDSFSGSITGVSAGTVVITYHNYYGSYATAPITINTLPAAITGTASMCEGESTTLATSSTGGAWSSSNNFVAMVDATTGNTTGLSADTATISYTSGTTGCVRSVVVTVNPLPFPITGPSTYCIGASDTLYEFGGGTWSTTATTIIALGATAGNITGLAAGTATITYTLATGCAATKQITVNPMPDAGTITSYEFVCIGGNITYASDACCGLWASSDAAIATVGSASGLVTGLTEGLTVISYTVTNACGTATAYAGVQVLSAADCTKLSVKSTGKEKAELMVSPNPAIDGNFTINLKADENEPADVVITNTVGEKVKSFTSNTNQTTDIKLEVAAGLYIISATTGHGSYTGKVVVQ